MKQLLFLLLFIPLALSSKGQQLAADISGFDKYLTDTVAPQFYNRFTTDEDLNNFRRLRDFLSEKQDLLQTLQTVRGRYTGADADKARYEDAVKQIKEVVKNKKEEDSVMIPAWVYGSYEEGYNRGLRDVRKSVAELNTLLAQYEDKVKYYAQQAHILTTIDKNISNVQQDIQTCQLKIDSALAPEYKQQDFRKSISLYFSVLIGVLLVIFFTIVFLKSDRDITKDLISDYGLQFITIFVLIISVILFGILNILQSSELAAILSGISGYILGKNKGTSITTTTPGTTPPNPPDGHQPDAPPPAPVIHPQSVTTIKV